MEQPYLEQIRIISSQAYFNVQIDNSIFRWFKLNFELANGSSGMRHECFTIENSFSKDNSAVYEQSWTGSQGESGRSASSKEIRQ